MLKRVLEYVLWTLAALLLGVGYMYLILGSVPEETTVISFIFSKIYYIGLFQVGGIIGSILAVIFILFDLFYLKRKWQPSKQLFRIRVFSMLGILVVIGVLHYLLEKTFDVI
jgi:hypothetical protein